MTEDLGTRRWAVPSRRTVADLLAVEVKMALREPIGLVFGIVLPVLLLVIFGLIPGLRRPIPHSGSLTYFFNYVPILIGMVFVMISLFSLPIPTVRNREIGWLRRISTTPVDPAWLLGARLVVNLAVAAVGAAVILAGAAIFFGVPAPRQPAAFVLSAFLGAAALFSIGLLIAALARSSGAAGAMATVLLYPLLFFAGLWAPMQVLPGLVRTISDYTPLAAAVQAMLAAMQGEFPPVRALVVLAAYAIVFGGAAMRLFRWE